MNHLKLIWKRIHTTNSIVLLFALCISAQPDVKLHVEGSAQFDKIGPALGRIILNTVSPEDPGRYGIQFSNNTVAPFVADDVGDQNYAFYSYWSNNRKYDAKITIHGKAVNSWGRVLELTHNGADGFLRTDVGDIILNPGNGSNNVGIGTNDPTDKLEVQGTAALDGEGGLLALRLQQNDSLRWTFLSAPWIGNNDLRIRREGGGDLMTFDYQTLGVGVGTTDPGNYRLNVSKNSATTVRINRSGTDGSLIDFHNDNTYAGGISVSGGSISYNSFTGAHIGTSEANFALGDLVRLSGDNGRMSSLENAEIIYGIDKTSTANDPSVLGAYSRKMDEKSTATKKNLHEIMAVGNGTVWVVDNGTDIAPGDYLISSEVLGHAMKDIGNYEISHIVARAGENVNWNNITSTVAGRKHHLISVFFENFDKANFEPKIEMLEKQLSDQNQLIKNLQREIDDLKYLLNTTLKD